MYIRNCIREVGGLVMGNRSGSMLNSVKETCSKSIYNNADYIINNTQKATSEKQGKMIKAMPACYCECSAGWFEKLFSRVLGKEVCVNLKHTILDGRDECMFEVKCSV